MDNENKQVRLKELTLERLKYFKKTPRESYDEIINRLLDDPHEIIRIKYELENNKKMSEKYIQEMLTYIEECVSVIKRDKPKGLQLPEEPKKPHIKNYIINKDSSDSIVVPKVPKA